MYIVAIGWLYVVVLMALAETNLVAGAMTLLFYGVLPVGLLLWINGSKVRRKRRLLADQRARDGNRGDPEPDQ